MGKPGRQIVARCAAGLREREQLDLIVANAENAAGGSGLTPPIYHELMAAGVDGITLGDHAFRRREIFGVLDNEPNIVRPGNFPADAPGKDCTVVRTANDTPVAVVCLLGRVFMSPVDCPFQAADRILRSLPEDVKVVLLDFHAEATSDMQIMGRFLDGRAFRPTHFEVASGDPRLHGTIVEFNPATGKATAIERLCVDQVEADRLHRTVRDRVAQRQ